MGRLTADPELKLTKSGTPCCSFSLAVNRPKYKDSEPQTDFIRCSAWRHTAKLICDYMVKGSLVVIEGALRISSYTDQNNLKRTSASVLINKVYFADYRRTNSKEDDDHEFENEEYDFMNEPEEYPPF